MQIVHFFSEITMNDLSQVGGKNASLGEMITHLKPIGIQVPKGFATSADAYRDFLKKNGLNHQIDNLLSNLLVDNVDQLKTISIQIKQLIKNGVFSPQFESAIEQAYHRLGLDSRHSVAVRSSATAEDLPEASFAGLQETFLNIVGVDNILSAIKSVYASLFTERAIAYRIHQGFQHQQVAISVGVQQMIRSDLASSGVIFTLDTESGFDQVIFITASYGLGEPVVQGAINPDEFYVHKPTLRAGKQSILRRQLGSKAIKMIYSKSDQQPLETVEVAKTDQRRFCLDDNDILTLAQYALIIEKHYDKAMDIEWAKDGIDNNIYIIQARPETVKARESHQYIEQYHLATSPSPIVTGRSIGQKIGQGRARYIDHPKQMDCLRKDEVLLTDMTDPDWEPIMKRAAAIITNRGGRTCHAAIIARELGIPAIVGCGDATTVISNDTEVTVSCAEGETGYVYPGLLQYRVEKTEIKNLPQLPIKMMLNLANPEQAFTYQYLPNCGIGLARLEFIISNSIGIHPNAILKAATPSALPATLEKAIREKTFAYENPTDFYIEKLAEGIATIAAAFFPKPVIVRFSDFKSNEYMNLLGGEHFEPKEENPMLGYRGGCRYVSPDFKECFMLECEAIKRVREQKGIDNVQVMFPFVRTVIEAKQVVELTKINGLERGKKGLKFYMMCEIPTNALLAEQFLEYFDGYSIGSNDLTQLTLGLDRDSERVAYLFDEKNEAVKVLLSQIIKTCKRLNKYVGICGQGPSDHLDLAAWLMNEGIDSLSLSPDSIVPTWLALKDMMRKR